MSDHRPRVERALRYILEHLDEPLPLAEVAKVAALSPHHFHRTFQAYTGEPVGRFVTRTRLERAAKMLAYERHRSITDIGLACGYSSSSNFAKAFHAWFGMSPSALRDGALGTGGKVARDFDAHALYEPDTSRLATVSACVRYEAFPGMDVVCLAGPGGYDTDDLTALWVDLIGRAQQLGLVPTIDSPVDTWGIAYDSPVLTTPELCRYHAAVPCPADFVAAAPLFRATIPEGRYAVFTWSGTVDGVDDFYRDIYSLWLPASSVEPDDHATYDRYVGDWPVDGHLTMEVWLKIKAR